MYEFAAHGIAGDREEKWEIHSAVASRPAAADAYSTKLFRDRGIQFLVQFNLGDLRS